MLVRWLVAVVVAFALFTTGCWGSDNGSSGATSTTSIKGDSAKIAGSWAGQLTQTGLPPFKVAAVIFDGAGKVAYTGIDCAGDWKLAAGGDPGPGYVFHETINEGSGGECKGAGTVHLEHFAPHRLRYSFEGGGVVSQGILKPAPDRLWTAIFREAGVPVGASSESPCPKDAPICGATVSGTPPARMSK